MKNAVCCPLLLAGFVLLCLSLSAHTQPAPADSQSSAPTETQPPRKLKVKRGSMQDIEAIGKRNITGRDWYSTASEIRMGQQLAQEVDSEVEFVRDPAITAYVNRIGQELVRNSDVQFPVTIKVIRSEMPIAFALPGGYLYVNTGLILAADNEAELAGVMAHALAHVAARHVTRMMTRLQFMNYMETPLIDVSNTKCNVYALCEHEQSIGLPLAMLKFSRVFELEADYLGFQYMYKTGYEPDAFVAFLERLEAKEGKPSSPAARAFAAHPPLRQRIEQARKEIAAILPARNNATINTPEFDEIKALVVVLPATLSPPTHGGSCLNCR